MSFFEKVKAATGQAAERLKDEAAEFQAKRQLSQAYADLGRQVADLAESGAISHESLAAPLERIKTLKAELAAAEQGPAEPPPSS